MKDYESGVTILLDTLDKFEAYLTTNRYIARLRGIIIKADWRLFVTLVRFIEDYPICKTTCASFINGRVLERR
ncbi:MAG: hypothetical protein ACSLEL_02820 [Candidatus Malihini olakiniferum]